MQYQEPDVITLVAHQDRQAVRRALRGLIIQPGAIGDCVLTLPLAAYMQETLGLGGVDVFGHMEYLSFVPGRTCVDTIRSMELMDLYRLFQEHGRFELSDRDPLIGLFADYTWIVSFLGEPGSSFEKNLIYTTMSSHSAEVICLPFRPPAGSRRHLSAFYISRFRAQCPVAIRAQAVPTTSRFIKATGSDQVRGCRILAEAGLGRTARVVVLHPGSGALKKCWHVENFLSLAESLGGLAVQPVFLIGPAERDRFGPKLIDQLARVAPVLEGLTLEDVLAVLAVSGAYVGNDSGISHMAGAMGVRTFVLFGPTNPKVYGPLGPRVTIFRDRAPRFCQRPCERLQDQVLARISQHLEA